MWLIESSANFFAGAYDHQRYYWDGYMYTTVNPHLALWQHYLYMVAKIKLFNHQIGKPESQVKVQIVESNLSVIHTAPQIPDIREVSQGLVSNWNPYIMNMNYFRIHFLVFFDCK